MSSPYTIPLPIPKKQKTTRASKLQIDSHFIATITPSSRKEEEIRLTLDLSVSTMPGVDSSGAQLNRENLGAINFGTRNRRSMAIEIVREKGNSIESENNHRRRVPSSDDPVTLCSKCFTHELSGLIVFITPIFETMNRGLPE